MNTGVGCREALTMSDDDWNILPRGMSLLSAGMMLVMCAGPPHKPFSCGNIRFPHLVESVAYASISAAQ